MLRPDGVLCALWIREDTSVEWVAAYREASGIRYGRQRDSTSDVGSLSPSRPAFGPVEHAAALARTRDYLTTCPATSSGEFTMPMVVDVLRTLRK